MGHSEKKTATFSKMLLVGSLILGNCAVNDRVAGQEERTLLASSLLNAPTRQTVRWENHFSQVKLREELLRQKVEEVAREWLGTPYEYGGESLEAMDCSSFTRRVYAQVCGFFLPRRAAWQFWEGELRFRDSLRTGDLLFFRINGAEVDHVGIYIGHQQFISATSSGGVRIDNLQKTYWKNHYAGARNLMVLLHQKQ